MRTRPARPEEWRNWAGTVRATAQRVERPRTVDEVVSAIASAARDGLPVRAVGSGHSFTPVAATDGVRLELTELAGLRELGADTVSVEAGMPLHRLNDLLHAHGRALANMGDIAYQTVSGAVATGTHGTGRDSAGLAQQLEAVELVLADGRVVTCSADEDPDLFAAARLGLGAYGIVTALRFRTEPTYLLHAHEHKASLRAVLDRLDRWVAGSAHVELYWLPFTDDVLLKEDDRTREPRRPLGRVRAWWELDVVENRLVDLSQRLCRAAPAFVPTVNRVSGRLVSTRDYVDHPHRVFTSERHVRFVEMEYAMPQARAVGVLTELRDLVASGPWRIGFPVEVRFAPADDVWLSTAYGRDTVYVAVHAYPGTDWEGYFAAAEELFLRHDGRPHWGKLHSLDAPALAARYPRFADALAVRDRVDPGGRFTNPYLARVLGR